MDETPIATVAIGATAIATAAIAVVGAVASKKREREEDNRTCSFCGKELSNSSSRKKHEDGVHRKIKPYKCHHTGCTYSASKKDHITTHMRIHTGERPFVCNHPGCTFSAAESGKLTKHMRIHTGEKPFVCTHPGCTFSATESGTLTKHMRIHTGEKPFVCTHPGCTFSATQSAHLTRHMRIHTGERPFVCTHPGCTFSAAESGNLTRHMRIHTGKKPYECGECRMAFAYSHNFSSHIRSIHLNLCKCGSEKAPGISRCQECHDKNNEYYVRCSNDGCEHAVNSENPYGTICATCWCRQNPKQALADPKNKWHKTEILIHCIISHFPEIFGDVIREKDETFPGGVRYRFDFILGKLLAALEVDGITHFADFAALNTKVEIVRGRDMNKMVEFFAKHGDTPFIRLHQPSAWNGYPVSETKPITWDAPSAIKHAMDTYKDQKIVIFIEPKDNTDYDEHKADCDSLNLPWVSLDAADLISLVPDERNAIFTN